MYTTREPRAQYDIYFALVRDIVTAAPSTRPFVDNINNLILTGEMYKALKEARETRRLREETARSCITRHRHTEK